MNERLTQDQFYLKFNFQKLLRMDIQDDDYVRIGQVLAIEPEQVRRILTEFERHVDNFASQTKLVTMFDQMYNRPAKIAFIGDSITSDRESYFNIIKRVLSGKKNLQFIDAARSGNTTVDTVCDLYAGVLSHEPDLACIMIGTNDLKRDNNPDGKILVGPQEYASNLDYIIARLLDARCQVIISTLPPTLSRRVQATYPELNLVFRDEDRNRYNGIIREAAAKHRIILNDMAGIYEEAGYEEALMDDGLHLSHIGQELLARQLLPKIVSALA